MRTVRSERLLNRFLEEIKKRGGTPLFSPSEWKYCKSRYLVRCHCGYEWEAVPKTVWSRGDWCKKCSGYLKKTGRDYHDIAIIYGGQWVGTKIPKNNKEDTQWVCAQGHKFDNDYNNIQQYNCFCRYCKKPFMGQMVTKLYLEGLTGLNFQTSRPKFLTYENGSPLELDGYNKEAAIAFEYNGIEHYEKSARQSQEAFEKLQKRDTWKYQKVMENNIKLLIIKEINGKFNEQHIKNSVLDFILREKIKLVENYKSITVDFPTMHSNYYLKNIKKACKSLNLTLIDTKYINSITPILIKCDLCLMERRVSPGNICHMANKGRKTYCSCTRKQKS